MSQPSSNQNPDFFESPELGSFDSSGGQPLNLGPGSKPVVEKHGFTVYTMMLILSFMFLTAASILLFIDAGKY